MTTRSEDRLETVYREHGERLWRALFAFAGDREVASEALAEAFAQALHRFLSSALTDAAGGT